LYPETLAEDIAGLPDDLRAITMFDLEAARAPDAIHLDAAVVQLAADFAALWGRCSRDEPACLLP
jgi:hypothetical protein